MVSPLHGSAPPAVKLTVTLDPSRPCLSELLDEGDAARSVITHPDGAVVVVVVVVVVLPDGVVVVVVVVVVVDPDGASGRPTITIVASPRTSTSVAPITPASGVTRDLSQVVTTSIRS